MQYAVLLYEDERIYESMTAEEVGAVMAQHEAFGARVEELGGSFVESQALQPTATARTVRWADDDVTVTDGPFAETAEQFGGFYVVDLPDLDAAIEAAKALPHDTEVRPVVVYEGDPDNLAAPPTDGPGDLFTVLLYGDEEPWLRATPAEREAVYAQHGKFAAGVVARGATVTGGQELAHSSTATSLRRAPDGEFVVTDGPFAETTEQLTGFYVIRAKDIDVVADALNELPGGTNEIRPVDEMAG
jgi:hypothetical protein